jgi:predicted DNA-binding transcriptional regulator AlpA
VATAAQPGRNRPARDGIGVAEACGLMGISRQTFWRRQDEPSWPRTWRVGRAVRVSRAAVLAWRERQQDATADRRREVAEMSQP